MAILKRKPEASKVLSVRVPVSVYKQFAGLQAPADAQGFDLRGSLTDAVIAWIKQVRKELGAASEGREALSASKARGAVFNGGAE